MAENDHLTPEERAERESLKQALAQYHADPEQWGIPERGPDNRWRVSPRKPPRPMESGFAKPQ